MYEIKLMNMSSAMIALQTGKADIMCGCVFATDERRKNVDFAIPHFQCRPGYFVRDTQPRSRILMAERFRMNLVTEERWKLIAHGLLETLKITILAILLGTVLGVVCIVVGCVAFVTVGFAVSEAGPLRQAVSIHAESTNAIARIAVFFIFNPPEV